MPTMTTFKHKLTNYLCKRITESLQPDMHPRTEWHFSRQPCLRFHCFLFSFSTPCDLAQRRSARALRCPRQRELSQRAGLREAWPPTRCSVGSAARSCAALAQQTPGATNCIDMQIIGYASIKISLLLTGFSISVAHHECLYNEKAKHCWKQ